MAVSSIEKLIKKKTVTGTTTSTGAIQTSLSTSKYVIIAARANFSSVCLPRDDSYVAVRSANDLTALANREVTVDVWYIEV